ncbi:PAS domain-containing protein [Candidatus Mesenet endosymbiont of Agriotes lineatus]|uniref:PAS domain-containing protein n=1 Tax=Candidatus Mesenet endosymbiont of Agriotes lineatus TaxID=3077948 RepID=UPI0030D2D041
MARFTEQRAVNRLCSYWNLLREDRNYPRKDEIELEEIKDILEYCFIIKVNETDDEKKKYNFVHLGSEVAEIYNMDTDIMHISPMTENLYQHLDSILTDKEPVIEDLDLQGSVGHHLIGRQCLLPLSDDNQEVNYILGAVSCRKEKYDYFYDVNT